VNFDELLRTRRSVRKFKNKPIEKERLDEILDSIKLAPSAKNLQSYEVFVLEGQARKDEMAKACFDQAHVSGAAAVLVFCADSSRGGTGKAGFYATLDATIATFTAMLKAWDLGIGSCWIGKFNDDEVRKALGLPDNLAPIAVLPLGYPDEAPAMRERRSDYAHRLG
jgi:nitroreductase